MNVIKFDICSLVFVFVESFFLITKLVFSNFQIVKFVISLNVLTAYRDIIYIMVLVIVENIIFKLKIVQMVVMYVLVISIVLYAKMDI